MSKSVSGYLRITKPLGEGVIANSLSGLSATKNSFFGGFPKESSFIIQLKSAIFFFKVFKRKVKREHRSEIFLVNNNNNKELQDPKGMTHEHLAILCYTSFKK